jgi:hypothetical protein
MRAVTEEINKGVLMLQANHDLYQERFPRSNRYDPDWVKKNQMGPSALWLTEWLCEKITIKP